MAKQNSNNQKKPRQNVITVLKNFFGISSKKVGSTDQEAIPFPGDYDKKKDKVVPLKTDDEFLELYKYWLQDTYETYDSLKNREERYKACQYAYYNNPIISATVDLYADEATQADSQAQTIKVYSQNKKLEKYINQFFDRIGVTQSVIREAVRNLTLYGDECWVLPTNDQDGVEEIVPVDPFSLKERFEFNATEVAKKMNQKKYQSWMQKDTRLRALQRMLSKSTSDFAKRFKKFLFGFQVESEMLPPWNVLHFRAFSNTSEFYPFGRPVIINSLAPFRQLQAAKNLMSLARAANFPIKLFKANVDPNADPVTQWEQVEELKENFHNFGNDISGKEEFTVNSEVWVPGEAVEVDSIDPGMDLDKIADVEMLRDDLIMGTRIPKGYLIVDQTSFGTSGQALLAQHKPFARAVYSLQSAILEQLTQLVRIQLAMTGEFDYDEPFELAMSFPESEESQDRISAKSDTLRLAKDLIDNLGEAMGLDRDEALPPEVVKQIFQKYSFVDAEEIDDWVNATTEMQNQGEEGEGEEGLSFESQKYAARQKIEERFNEDLFRGSYFLAKRRNNMTEGTINKEHFYSSFAMNDGQRRMLNLLSIHKDGKLEEILKGKEANISEQIEKPREHYDTLLNKGLRK